MRRGGRVFIILGVLLALISAAGVFYVLATAEPQPVEIPTTKLVVAFQPVDERTEIAADQVGQVDWPQKIPTPIGATSNPSEVVGKLALKPIYAGEPIIDKMVISKEDAKAQGSNATLIIEKGNVGIALDVTLATIVAEAVQAGDHVDMLATFTVQPQATTNTQAATGPIISSQRVLQDMLVLQVGPWPGPKAASDTNNRSNTINVVTLQLQEQDALVLKYVQENATGTTLVLRSANDHQQFNPEPVTLEYINKRFGFKFPLAGQ